MKRKVYLIIVAFAVAFAGCNSNNSDNETQQNIAEQSSENSFFNSLTDEQQKILTQEDVLTEDAVNQMDYEAVNWNLLGTGHELYNQSSGVETNGLSYEEKVKVNDKSDSDKLITMEKALQIRMKEKEMRLTDFAEFKYDITTSESEKNNAYVMELPLNDYENAYVNIAFTREENNIINMKVPYIIYKGDNENTTFSLLYDQPSLKAFFEEEPKNTYEGKVYIGLQYGSVTENSLVLNVFNWSDTEYKIRSKYEIYEVSDEGEKMIDSSEGSEDTRKSQSFSIEGIQLNEGVKLSKGKTYVIKYGIDKDEYIYDEIEFEMK